MDRTASMFFGNIIGLALCYSLRQNPRRLEALTYPVWFTVAMRWCFGLEDVFLIAPQFPIYSSPLGSNPDPDRTMGDSQAKGVFVDACVVLPIIEFRNTPPSGSQCLQDFLKKCLKTGTLDHHILKVDEALIPLVKEFKRLSTRHPVDILQHAHAINQGLEAAKNQVEEQVQILFCSVKFARQDVAIAIAGAGDVWCFRAISRAEAQRRDKPSTRKGILERLLDDPDAYDDDEEETYNENGLLARLLGPVEHELVSPDAVERKAQMLREQDYWKKEQEEWKERIEYQRVERASRAERRAQRAFDEPARKLEAFVKENPPSEDATGPPFSDQQLNQLAKLQWEAQNLGEPSNDEIQFFESNLMPSHQSLLERKTWTRPLRFGTPASDAYEKLIRMYLTHLAKEERERRTKLAA